MKVPSVILMYPAERLARPLLALRQAGMAVRGCSTPAELLALLDTEPPDAVALDLHPLGPHAEALVSTLRRTSRLGIVVGARNMDAEGRIRMLQCGADACLADASDERELAQLLLALGRRLAWAAEAGAPPAEPAGEPGQWTLQDQDWTLVAPNGREFPLSANERILVRTLLSVKGRTVSREELAEALLQGNGRVRAVGPRSVDVLVSRLRRRVARNGGTLSLRTVYGSGYLFVDE